MEDSVQPTKNRPVYGIAKAVGIGSVSAIGASVVAAATAPFVFGAFLLYKGYRFAFENPGKTVTGALAIGALTYALNNKDLRETIGACYDAQKMILPLELQIHAATNAHKRAEARTEKVTGDLEKYVHRLTLEKENALQNVQQSKEQVIALENQLEELRSNYTTNITQTKNVVNSSNKENLQLRERLQSTMYQHEKLKGAYEQLEQLVLPQPATEPPLKRAKGASFAKGQVLVLSTETEDAPAYSCMDRFAAGAALGVGVTLLAGLGMAYVRKEPTVPTRSSSSQTVTRFREDSRRSKARQIN